MVDLKAPIPGSAMGQARTLLATLPPLDPAHEYINTLYMHWSVGTYTQTFEDYNICIASDGQGSWHAAITNDPHNNAASALPVGYAAHTWHRNSHALGLSICAMYGATGQDFGQYPLTQVNVDLLCAAVAACGLKYNIDVSSAANVMTHAEAAILDDYFGERWDLCRVNPAPAGITQTEALLTGEDLRVRIHQAKVLLATA